MSRPNTSLPSLESCAKILNASFAKDRNPAVKTLSGQIVGWADASSGTSYGVVVKERDLPYGSLGTLCIKFQVGSAFEEQAGSGLALSGLAAVALDAVCANAVVWLSRLQQTVATLEQKCTFLAPVPVDVSLYAFAHVLRLEDDLGFLEAELRVGTPDGPVIVRASQSNALLPIKRPSPRL
mmetsp:Transcript_9884/g.18222  ORF Transcript_9884/g.18222 Transcript_9884/m.18222 type:complete len:181 (+) Transcript_9884:94-636(+)